MSLKIGVVMDPIEGINFKKDSTLAMLLEAQSRGWQLYYMEQADLYIAHDASAPFILLFHQAGWSRGEYLEIAPKLIPEI